MVETVSSGSNTRDTCMQVIQVKVRLIMLIMEQIISIFCFWDISLSIMTLRILASAHEPMMSFVRNSWRNWSRRAKYLVTSIWTWRLLRWFHYFFAALQIIFYSRLFTVLYFSVRSSRSRALRYGLPPCMSVKTTKGAGGGFSSPPARPSFGLLPIASKFGIDLASPSPRWVISFTPRLFENWEMRQGFCCGFCEEWKLV